MLETTEKEDHRETDREPDNSAEGPSLREQLGDRRGRINLKLHEVSVPLPLN